MKVTEARLKAALDRQGLTYSVNEGDGAFYGPKIDLHMLDSLGRGWQIGTVQLDFQLPIRFNLSFINELGEKEKPVIIHRAILGSVERMIAILTESSAGKWPFWLSPRQCVVVPVGPMFDGYAQQVCIKICLRL